tara:strand:+ start:4370 stop:4972 length:603 start_codon:yes stop_codon:yes gene_type:complete
MGKYDDMFNEHFNNEEFGGDPDKRKIALKSFNKMMESLENVKISDEFVNKYLKNLDLQSLTDSEESIFNEEGSIMLPIFKDTGEMIKNRGMIFEKIKLKRKNGHFIVIETWTSKDEEYILNQKYFLDIDIFETKDLEIQEKIVKKLVNSNYIKDNKNEYLNHLPIDSQKKFYQTLLNRSIESELYEESAIYRDKIDSLLK